MKVALRYDITLNTGNYNNFKPSIEFVVDTEQDIERQIEEGRNALGVLRPSVSQEMEKVLEEEGVKGWESLLVKHDRVLKGMEERINEIELSISKNPS